MKDAIFGCMGGQPNNTREVKVESQCSEQTSLFSDQYNGDDSNGFRRSEVRQPVSQRSRSKSSSPPKARSRITSRSWSKRDQGQSKFYLETIPKGSQQPRQISSRYKSYQKNVGRRHGEYLNREHVHEYHCNLCERQYKRDLLKRQSSKLPLLEYTYSPTDGKPIRGILKKPRYVRTPRMDELVVIEVWFVDPKNQIIIPRLKKVFLKKHSLFEKEKCW